MKLLVLMVLTIFLFTPTDDKEIFYCEDGMTQLEIIDRNTGAWQLTGQPIKYAGPIDADYERAVRECVPNFKP